MCSGHRIGTAEVESALVSHPQCAEAAVVGVEHEVTIHGCFFSRDESLTKRASCLSQLQMSSMVISGIVFQVKGQGIYAFVTLVEGAGYSEELRKSLILTVRKQVGLSATLDDYDQYWP